MQPATTHPDKTSKLKKLHIGECIGKEYFANAKKCYNFSGNPLIFKYFFVDFKNLF